jgi:hypothetical protein
MPRKLRVTTTSFAFTDRRSVEANCDAAAACVSPASDRPIVCTARTGSGLGRARPIR